MAKKRVSSVDLTWIIVEQMKEDDSFANDRVLRPVRPPGANEHAARLPALPDSRVAPARRRDR